MQLVLIQISGSLRDEGHKIQEVCAKSENLQNTAQINSEGGDAARRLLTLGRFSQLQPIYVTVFCCGQPNPDSVFYKINPSSPDPATLLECRPHLASAEGFQSSC